MSSKYYSEFDFYRRLLRIIESDSNSDYKVRAIKCAILEQFNNFDKLLKKHRVTVRIAGEEYYSD